MWVAAARAFMLTSKMNVISALLSPERLRSSCSATQHRTHTDPEVLSMKPSLQRPDLNRDIVARSWREI
jgi:hypothetical protein